MLGNLVKLLRDNSRLRWGLSLILGILWFYIVLMMRETLDEKKQLYSADAQTVSRLQTQLAQKEWIARELPAKAMVVQMEGRLWQATTSGLAQAAFQDWLNAVMIKSGLLHPQIAVTVIDEIVSGAQKKNQEVIATTPADLWKIKAKLSFDFNDTALMTFLKLIEDNDKLLVIDKLEVRRDAAHVEVELYSYFQKQAAPIKSNDTDKLEQHKSESH